MRILTSVASYALLSLMLCGFGSCGKSIKLSAPPPIECSAIAKERCDPAVVNSAPLAQTEKDDVLNRASWHACVIRHEAAVKCLEALEEQGYVEER